MKRKDNADDAVDPPKQAASLMGVREPLGAQAGDEGTQFRLLTTAKRACAVRLFDSSLQPIAEYPLQPTGAPGVYGVKVPDARPGALYKFVVDGQELPDPYARFLPHGVHGPALVLDGTYAWRHPCVSRPLRDHVIYELHVGTFTGAGTYDAAAQRLEQLVQLGVTAIELLPIAAFPGERGWGYDGVAPFAPFAPYGTPDQLRSFIDRAHELGLSVFLDVVYNHLGPDGNYLSAYSPDYFNHELKNAWGAAPNYAHAPMRRFVVSNALYWLHEFRFDGLRLDATHAIIDPGAKHILREIAELVAAEVPGRLLMAEDERNDPALVTELGLDGIWADDFHHAIHVTLTREQEGYYGAYEPGAATAARTIERGWLFEGALYPSSGEPRGKPADALAAECFVYCIQNHDQVGNRAFGERLSATVPLEAYRAASTVLLFLPMTPLLFMGQEWAATSPFQFFTDHTPELGELVSKGRREEFKGFSAFQDPKRRAQIPDPQAASTFERSKLPWDEREREPHRGVLELYERAIALRRNDPVLRASGRDALEATSVGSVLVVRRSWQGAERVLLANLGADPMPLDRLPVAKNATLLLSSQDGDLTGTLAPWQALVLGAGTVAEHERVG